MKLRRVFQAQNVIQKPFFGETIVFDFPIDGWGRQPVMPLMVRVGRRVSGYTALAHYRLPITRYLKS